jgi:hypothetical protein
MTSYDPHVRAASKPSLDIVCERYVRGHGRRCRNYVENGTCALPEELMCVEWLRANGYSVPAPITDVGATVEGRAPELAEITAEDVASFKALGIEICLSSTARGDVWLVPEYTGQARNEITPEDAALVMKTLTLFPGAKLVSLKRPSQTTNAKGERS